MIRHLTLFLLLTLMLTRINAQLYYTKNAGISFFSRTALQDIKADNNQAISVLNIETGAIQVSLLTNAFHFPKAKMEEDFNEDYIESAKYPKSTFKGIITDISKIDVAKNARYVLQVTGDLMIHGVTKNMTVPATISIKNGNISATASFNVLVKDYNIRIPTIVENKVAENIQITINCDYEKK